MPVLTGKTPNPESAVAVLLFLIYSAVMFGAGYYYHSHSGYASPQERLASRISMLGKL